MTSELFRKEVLENKKGSLQGEVILSQSFSFTAIIALIIGFVILMVIVLMNGEYHRKEIVSGFLQPSKGLIKNYPVVGGTIDKINVKEGDLVSQGDVLAKIINTQHLVHGHDINILRTEELKEQQENITQQLEDETLLLSSQTLELEQQQVNAERLIKQYAEELTILQKRIDIKKKNYDEYNNLKAGGHISQTELWQKKESLLALEQQQRQLTRKQRLQKDQLAEYPFQLTQLPIKSSQRINVLKLQLSNIKQRLSDALAQQSYEIRASKSGRLTNVMVKQGERVTSNTLLFSILPEGSTLEAVILVPTRAFGFVKKGQETNIRFQAFPYQRFGNYKGVIEKVSKAVLLPNEVQSTLPVDEPVYKVVIALDQQHVTAYGSNIPLQSGMLFEADIYLDTRTLLAWLLDPIFSLRGRL